MLAESHQKDVLRHRLGEGDTAECKEANPTLRRGAVTLELHHVDKQFKYSSHD